MLVKAWWCLLTQAWWCLLTLAWRPALASVVTMAQGNIRGEVHQGYTSYSGIPYATLAHNGKFKRAGLAPTWNGVRESQPSRCSVSSGAEACLTLDVHVPTSGSAPWPVLAWPRAGGRYHPAKLAQQGIIVVMISHRLGPPGFLCLDDERMPGNAGAKDVVLALRWVRDNISAFLGNPHKVVVGGQGFGAALVEALVAAPMAQGLFHGAVIQSGSALCPWAFNYDAKERALTLAQMMDETGEEAETFMKADLDILGEKSDKMAVSYIPFGMCVEKSFKNEERFLPEPPNSLLANKFTRKVPLIIGFNSDEAYIFLSVLRNKNLRGRMMRDMSFLLPEELKFPNEDELKNAVKQIRDTYFKNNNFSIAALLTYHRDAYFASHIQRSVRLHAASPLPVYYYRFSHAGGPGVHPDHEVDKAGAAHADELAYLFPETSGTMEGADGVVQQHLLRLWTNYVKHLEPTLASDPGPRWEPADASHPRLLDIGEGLAMADAPGRLALWDHLYERFYYAMGPAPL